MSTPIDYKTDTEAMLTLAVEDGGMKPPTAKGGAKRHRMMRAIIDNRDTALLEQFSALCITVLSSTT